MSYLSKAGWLNKHLYQNRSFDQLTELEISALQNNLALFKSEDPEVSVVIPAYNEENSIFRTLSSLAENKTILKVEIIIINNNSTDDTQQVIDKLGVTSYFQPKQGIAYARQLGLAKAKGKYHLCADADSLYPPDWIEIMTRPMMNNKNIVGVYGRYSILPPEGVEKLKLLIYEKLTGLLIRIRRKNKEHINVLGFNMGFVSELGRKVRGFEVRKVRKFSNSKTDKEYTDLSEDGQMAYLLKEVGELKMINNPKARVFTSARRLLEDGSIANAFKNRLRMHSKNILHYWFPSYFVFKRH